MKDITALQIRVGDAACLLGNADSTRPAQLMAHNQASQLKRKYIHANWQPSLIIGSIYTESIFL